MSTDTREKLSTELPAALATRLRTGLSLAHGRATLEELPARLRAQLQVLAARVRRALDVPSQSEISELARRVEALAHKLDELDGASDAEAGPSAEAVRDELRAEIRAVAAEAQDAARAAREAADKRPEAVGKAKAAPKGSTNASPKASTNAAPKASTNAGASKSGKSSGGKGSKTQRKTRAEAVANKTSRKTPRS
jgi:hypothetical protein